LYSERLIKISLFLREKLVDIGEIKQSIENSGEHLSELHLTVQKDHQRAEMQAAQYHSDLLVRFESGQDKIDEQLLKLEKIEHSKFYTLVKRGSLTGDRKAEGEDPPMA
jgi:tRNA isopentenyl-2-thiomethyl-A-37 hydroxylase MiaE